MAVSCFIAVSWLLSFNELFKYLTLTVWHVILHESYLCLFDSALVDYQVPGQQMHWSIVDNTKMYGQSIICTGG